MIRLNVGTKLWLAFVGTITICVLTLYLLLHNSLRASFLDYTSQQSVQRLEILRSALGNIYQDDGSFQLLASNPSRWLSIKEIIFSETDTLFTNTPQSQTVINTAPQAYYREFVSTVSLHDTNKKLLLGVTKPNQPLNWIPVTSTNQLVGYISFAKPTAVNRTQDRNFIQHQFKVFGILSLLVLVIATLVATFFARRISKPLTALAQNSSALAAGDYSRKMPVTSHDEIGQLCNSFNLLGKALAANKKSQANWVADISHEMRTPLSVLKMQIEAMQDGVRPLNTDSLTLLHAKTLGLNKLVDDLFELSLSDAGTLSYQKEKVNIGTLLKTCIEHYQVKALSAKLTLENSINSELNISVLADTNRLQQLFTNILENSVRYTDAGGLIYVKLNASETQVNITIDDSSPGIPAGQEDKIFNRFYRIENSRSRDTGGAGLGLAICENIVSAHQGSITADQSPLGGLQISIDLPRIVS